MWEMAEGSQIEAWFLPAVWSGSQAGLAPSYPKPSVEEKETFI